MTVRNTGAKPSAATSVRVTSETQVLGEGALPALEPGASSDVLITLTETVSHGTVEMTANPDSDGSDEVTLLNNVVGVRLYASSDFDQDGDVDLADFAIFAACFNGPNRPPAGPNCDAADFDNDNDVDLADFAIFAACFNGPNRPPACAE